MKLIIAYVICGILTAMIAVFEKTHKGGFDPYNIDEIDEEDIGNIGNIVLLWWLYIYQKLTERSE